MSPRRITLAAACLLWLVSAHALAAPPIVTFNDDGGWCWFEDERAIVHAGQLFIGSVASGAHDAARRGNIEVVQYGLGTGEIRRSVLHERFQCDDHDSPALLVRRDGRLLAMYCRHGGDPRIYYRIGTHPGDATPWGREQVFVPSEKSRVTYSNLFRLADENQGRGRVYNFFRGWDNHFKPSWMVSDDEGQTWSARGLWIDFPAPVRHRPYVKYASDDRHTIHFVFTEGHPRNFDNSIYHAYYRAGHFYCSDGAPIKRVADGPVTPATATRVFAGDAQNVAWTSDLHLDREGRPVLVYSVQRDPAALPPAHPQSGRDHRYRYARWDGRQWQDHEIAHAGSRLYAGEDDYTGTICLDPDDINRVYLSTNVDPASGAPGELARWQIYRGVTDDFGATWQWTALTRDSSVDNLRPIVPRGSDGQTVVLWLRGRYRSFTDYDLDVVGLITPPAAAGTR